jgi:hypothetical protein
MSDPEPGTGAGGGTLFRLWLKPKVSVSCGSSSGSAALRRNKKCIKNSMYSFFMNVLYIQKFFNTTLTMCELYMEVFLLFLQGVRFWSKNIIFSKLSLCSRVTHRFRYLSTVLLVLPFCLYCPLTHVLPF